MSSLVKLVVILCCVQRGQSHWLKSLIDQKRETASSSSNEDKSRYSDEDEGNVQTGAPGLGTVILGRARRSAPDSQCGLRSILLQVRDLGLGYDSDETVLFKYCSGLCPRVRSNHDLTLANLLLSGMLPSSAPEGLWHSAPCCRPTHHEDMAFLDNSHRWHKVEKLLAAGCSCVG